LYLFAKEFSMFPQTATNIQMAPQIFVPDIPVGTSNADSHSINSRSNDEICMAVVNS
jgi:hypothetical protein